MDASIHQGRTAGGASDCSDRKLMQLHNARSLRDLRAPPGNRLEELMGDRSGQHSIWINGQWRVCFVWRDGDAYDVEIVDYH